MTMKKIVAAALTIGLVQIAVPVEAGEVGKRAGDVPGSLRCGGYAITANSFPVYARFQRIKRLEAEISNNTAQILLATKGGR